MKRCPDCNEEKPPTEFGRNRSLPDGLSFYCSECNRRRNGAWYRQSRAAMGKSVRDHSWVPEGFRWCPGCRQAVPHEDFSRNARQASGFGSLCLPCHRTSSNDAYWKRRYGLTRSDVAALRAAQGDACAICDASQPEHLDHDHETGRIRALLCQRCNQGLGLLRDDPVVLRAAADYVEQHRDAPAALAGRLTADDLARSTHRAPAGSPRAGVCSHGFARWRAMQATS
ncbi:endonuclease VII domain-containing protein [Modestobacter sp. VKM Ac-2978]|uniref:endonuclease VII domain-containing protein n=1 Tax=Modestobacter sp. VKM Ac-2978 TaxID=3004132 RepID=UPI002F26CEEE